jgi:SAM-dependent methyltransferase
MSRFGLYLVELLNRWFPPLAIHRQLDAAKLSDRDYQRRGYAEAAQICPVFGDLWDVEDKYVLDVGGGLGEKSAYCVDQGARVAISLDLRLYSSKAALAWARERQQAQAICPIVGNAARMPLADRCLDVVLSVNTFEHLDDVRGALIECKRVLKPQGVIFLHFPPFYSPWGAHLEGWINFPWPHVFFSDRVLIQAAQRMEERRRKNEDFIAPAKVDWAHAERLPNLNRITARQFLRLVRALDLKLLEARMLPFGWRYFATHGPLARALLAVLKRLATLPLLREVLTTKMVFVLVK